MKKSKAKDIDLFYVGEGEKEKTRKAKKMAGNSKPASKKKKKEKTEKENDDIFRFDDEIVIGITKIEDKPKEKKKQKKEIKEEQVGSKVTKKALPKEKRATKQEKTKGQKENKKTEKKQKKHNHIVKVVQYFFLLMLLCGGIVYFLLSPVFNIKNITVIDNKTIATEEIISLSGIAIEENTFKVRLGQAEQKIKENAYVESVQVKRKLPSEIQIIVEERTPTYMLEFVNSMVYINNQGYMLEISENKLDVPIITGYETVAEEIKPGNRLCKNDLYKLETVLKIMETANSYEIGSYITKINIADKNNYTLILEGEKKIVYLGDASNINTRIMYLKKIIELEKGVESEVFINGDVNKDDVYTREKV